MPSPDVKALLATDLVDSTGTTERAGERAAAELWTAHDRLARELLTRWHGREIDKTDGFLLLFDDARSAAGFALDYHRALAGLAPPLAARAGLHVAPIALELNAPDDVARGAKPFEIGDWAAKALVARAMALAPGGRTIATAQAAEALRGEPLGVAALGHWRLQGFAEPVELFGLHDAGTDRSPVPDAPKAHGVVRRGDRWVPRREIRHTLPAEHDSFVGRRDALQDLADRFAGGARLVSVLGAGGTGKTRLALRFGREWIGDFPGGVWFCDLASAQGLEGMVYALAQGLDLRLSHDDPIGQLGVAIAGRPDCLVILDNVEQVASHANGPLDRWLSACPDASFLATSRSALHVNGENQCTLDPLPPPEAAALFAGRAADGGARLDHGSRERTAIDALVRMLDGLPLAVELAAARAKVLTPSAMVERMSQRFRLLTSAGGRPGRQATLRTTLDWSWDLLRPSDRIALAQLSVFEGGFRLADAEAVLGPSLDAAEVWTVDAIQSLLDQSMIRRAPRDRFEMLASIQAYAAERLVADGQFPGSGPALAVEAERRHWTHFAGFDDADATADGCAALENLVIACRRATAAGDAAGAAGALHATWAVLRLTGPFREGVSLARQVDALPGLSPGQRSRVQRVLGSAHEMLGDIDEARARHLAALEAADASGDDLERGWALLALGEHHYKRGDATTARDRLDAARRLAERLEARSLLCATQQAIGTLEWRLGRSAEATRHYTTALALARGLGDLRLEGGILGNLALLSSAEASDDVAKRQYEEALALTRQVNDRKWEGNIRCNLGLLLQEQGATLEAEAQFGAALLIAREIGHALLEATVNCNLGILAEESDDWIGACAHHERAVEVARRMADKRAEGQFRGHFGHALARLGRRDDAALELDRGERCLREVSDEISLGLLFCQRAKAARVFGANEDVATSLEQAREQLRRRPNGELRAAVESIERLVLQAAGG